MKYRVEKDTMGTIEVPADKLWGAQTQRSLLHFDIGSETMPREIIKALGYIKKAAALVNAKLGGLTNEQAALIADACDQIISGNLDAHFPLSVWQSGSGTHTNMNVNEVIANYANQQAGKIFVHPNNHVNLGQSSNDIFPSAMHITVVCSLEKHLFPALNDLRASFTELRKRYAAVIKIGRTHLQDATPLSLGEEIGAWAFMLSECKNMLRASLQPIRALAIGGTAVGTGLNTHQDFAILTTQQLSTLIGKDFYPSANYYHSLTSKDTLVHCHSALKALAADLFKIANDIRLLASGPRCGIGELQIPQNEPRSSIMPGKVNPSQCEALSMVCLQVMANDVAVGMTASQGHLQLNAFMPLLIYNFLQSIRLLADAIRSFQRYCAEGIVPNREVIEHNLKNSLMLVTALSPHIGYEQAANIAQTAHQKGICLQEAAVQLGLLSDQEFERLVQPQEMIQPKKNL